MSKKIKIKINRGENRLNLGPMKMHATMFQKLFYFILFKKIINIVDELFLCQKGKTNLVGHMMACLVHV